MAEEEIEKRDSSTNTDSDRVLVTKRAVFRALVELMAERDFDNITVGDILERSGVSRTTFYRCFEDKYDVVNWSFKRFKNIRIQNKDQFYSFESSLLVMNGYLREHKDYFARALRYRGQNSLRDYMYETNVEYMEQCWRERYGAVDGFGQEATIRFAAAGMSKIIEEWILGGCAEPDEEVGAAIVALVPDMLREVLY